MPLTFTVFITLIAHHLKLLCWCYVGVDLGFQVRGRSIRRKKNQNKAAFVLTKRISGNHFILAYVFGKHRKLG